MRDVEGEPVDAIAGGSRLNPKLRRGDQGLNLVWNTFIKLMGVPISEHHIGVGEIELIKARGDEEVWVCTQIPIGEVGVDENMMNGQLICLSSFPQVISLLSNVISVRANQAGKPLSMGQGAPCSGHGGGIVHGSIMHDNVADPSTKSSKSILGTDGEWEGVAHVGIIVNPSAKTPSRGTIGDE